VGPVINAIEAVILKEWTVKGLNLAERQVKMLNTFGPREGEWIETDYSRFDQTLLPELLQLEQDVYLHYYNDPTFAMLIREQARTHGVHVKGPGYNRVGGRCSGDPNTSIGNCIVNLFVAWCAHQLMGEPCIGFVEGDDGLFRYKPGLDKTFINVATSLGLRLKLEVTQSPKFCGRFYNHIWVSHCELKRTLDKFCLTNNTTQSRQELCALKCYSLMSTDPSHPVFGFALLLLLNRLGWPEPKVSGHKRYLPNYYGMYTPTKAPLPALEYAVTLADISEQGYSPAYLEALRSELLDWAGGTTDIPILLGDSDTEEGEAAVYW
jgi:hypothetical protein